MGISSGSAEKTVRGGNTAISPPFRLQAFMLKTGQLVVLWNEVPGRLRPLGKRKKKQKGEAGTPAHPCPTKMAYSDLRGNDALHKEQAQEKKYDGQNWRTGQLLRVRE